MSPANGQKDTGREKDMDEIAPEREAYKPTAQRVEPSSVLAVICLENEPKSEKDEGRRECRDISLGAPSKNIGWVEPHERNGADRDRSAF